jgi:hypothetical protein
MKNMLSFAIVLGLVGIGVGYFVFGKILGNYVDIRQLVLPDRNALETWGKSLVGIDAMRTNILLCGAGGAIGGGVIGLLMSLMKKR